MPSGGGRSRCARGREYEGLHVDLSVWEHVELRGTLACGARSRVLAGVHRTTGEDVAIKQPTIRTQSDLNRFHRCALNDVHAVQMSRPLRFHGDDSA